MAVTVTGIVPGSPAERAGIPAGSRLISADRHPVDDVLDYRFYTMERKIRLQIILPNGKKKVFRIRKEEDEEIGLEFETYLMSGQTGCRNKCVFCFIDQLPQGMRETLYFKDDDERLSFLFGNYITLTNLDDRQIDRIIRMRISPVNISVHTSNPELRVRMMKNKNAGAVLGYIPRLAEAGIFMNVQLVLCPGWNDGEELVRSLDWLSGFYPQIQSIACVPVGLTRFREGLTRLDPYTEKTASETLDIIENYSSAFLKLHGVRLVYPADEFFLLAKRSIPSSSYYDEFLQLENGVGMSALLRHEFRLAMKGKQGDDTVRRCVIATSKAAFSLMSGLVDEAVKKWHNLDCKVIKVTNRFFGESITVAGLITGEDLERSLRESVSPGERVLFSANMLRAQRDVFLDGRSPAQIEKELGMKLVPVENDGYELLERLLEE